LNVTAADAKHETNKLKRQRVWQTPALSFLTGMTDAPPTVGIAPRHKGDVTSAAEKFCEILRRLTDTCSRIASVKGED
jgi:hypothetical protein